MRRQPSPRSTRHGLWLCVAALALGACVASSPDGEDDVGLVPGGKADGSDYSACELSAVVSQLNGGLGADRLIEAGVHSRAARNLVERRNGTDGEFGTDDDRLFETIADVDAVSWVGPVAIQQLVDMVQDRCQAGPTQAEVIMSPQVPDQSHLARIRDLINEVPDGGSIDIAIYSFSDRGISDALASASSRGVRVRFLFEDGGPDSRSPMGSTSARLEDMGIEVRYVNKIMHHKFALLSGPREDLGAASTGVLVTGSGNWSSSAATRYDENTLIVRGNAELNLRYQREFNRLWDNSRPVEWNESIAPIDAIAIDDASIPDDPSVDAVFTSANFEATISSRYGPTFSGIRNSNAVSDRWVSLILGAQRSIRIASGHLRSRPVAEALIRAHEANPSLDIRVYLDGQEYLAEGTHDAQVRDLDACLEGAGESESRRGNCLDRGFLFSYQVHASGIALRYKYYAYRWDFSYAPQMHHKYMIIDDSLVVAGSYNLSDNAEHATMENDVILEGDAFRSVIDAYIDNFDTLWVTGEADGLYDSLMDDARNGEGSLRLVFEPMALSWDQVTDLKNALRDACPDINSTAFRTNPAAHRTCAR
ncbi:MAG: phospholipase D-like domain-containing protein [Sandaracinaceae bacterium]